MLKDRLAVALTGNAINQLAESLDNRWLNRSRTLKSPTALELKHDHQPCKHYSTSWWSEVQSTTSRRNRNGALSAFEADRQLPAVLRPDAPILTLSVFVLPARVLLVTSSTAMESGGSARPSERSWSGLRGRDLNLRSRGNESAKRPIHPNRTPHHAGASAGVTASWLGNLRRRRSTNLGDGSRVDDVKTTSAGARSASHPTPSPQRVRFNTLSRDGTARLCSSA